MENPDNLVDFKVVLNKKEYARVTTSNGDFRLKFQDDNLHGRTTGYFYSSPQDDMSTSSFMIEFKNGHMVSFKFYNRNDCVLLSRHNGDKITSMTIHPHDSIDPEISLNQLLEFPYRYADLVMKILTKL